MDFSFSEEQKSFRRTVRQFAMNELLPNYARWDREREFPRESQRKMGAAGLTALGIPEKFGGVAADHVTIGIAVEECARGDFTCAYFAVAKIPASMLSLAHPDIQHEWIPPLARGEKNVSTVITEPHCGSDATAITTSAVRDGDQYVLNGEKSSATFAAVAEAVVVFARSQPGSGARGISAFFIPGDTPGLSRAQHPELGQRAAQRGSFYLDNVRVPVKNLVGSEGQGFAIFGDVFNFDRPICALMCIGAAQQTLDETVEYVKTRRAFGQPITRYQGVPLPIAEAATMLEAARLLSYKALWLRDQGLPHGKEAAMAKWWATRMAVDVVHQCLLLHGHAGYSEDYPVSQRLRDVISLEIGGGTAEIMKLIIAREIIGREFRSS